jgi:hypothetical protein
MSVYDVQNKLRTREYRRGLVTSQSISRLHATRQSGADEQKLAGTLRMV